MRAYSLCLLLEISTWAAEPYPGFWKQWGDGQAELAGYDLTIARYGQSRKGTAVTIFVTEPFSKSLRVKADPGKHPASDETPVMKLNLVKDYQTGIYDYNEMLSAFIDLEAGTPLKLSFSRQEWCGHVFQQALFDPGKIRVTSHSYFDGEADKQETLNLAAGTIGEDTLPLIARGFLGPKLKPGESRPVRMMAALGTIRGKEGPVSVVGAVLKRANGTSKVTVPAGTFETELWSVEMGTAYKREIWIEKGGQGRIVRWQASSGEKAELTGSTRNKYWQLTNPGGEAELSKLGLKARPPRTM